ncbi:hypothetical protein [Halorubrum sp. Ib24]|uniref:hypothetical protein n=1 Tax=Halorubrum sp. Ib24 TaxID=1383850 RepID=UPI001F52E6E0|nr:hypothetical protein [Halorubrum sp. Ib24]
MNGFDKGIETPYGGKDAQVSDSAGGPRVRLSPTRSAVRRDRPETEARADGPWSAALLVQSTAGSR